MVKKFTPRLRIAGLIEAKAEGIDKKLYFTGEVSTSSLKILFIGLHFIASCYSIY